MERPMSDLVKVEREGAVTLLTVQRPEKLNALNRAVLIELGARIAELSAEPAAERSRCVILTGSGERAFVAGADIGELGALDAAGARLLSDLGHRLGRAMEEAP